MNVLQKSQGSICAGYAPHLRRHMRQPGAQTHARKPQTPIAPHVDLKPRIP